MTDFQLCKNSSEVPGKICEQNYLEKRYEMGTVLQHDMDPITEAYLGQLHQFLKFKNCLKIKALNAKL